MHIGIAGRAIRVNSIWICFKEASPGCKTEGRAKDNEARDHCRRDGALLV